MKTLSHHFPFILVRLAIIAGLGVAAGSRAAAAQSANCNLAPNPAFEQGTSTSISQWQFWPNGSASTFSVSTYPAPVESGARAAQIVVTQPGDVLFYTTEPGNIPVYPNTPYRISARVKSDPGKIAGFRVIEWTSQQAVVADNFIGLSTGLGDWETVEGTLTTHSNTAFVSLRLSHHVSAGTFIWDDVMFARDDPQRCVDVRHYIEQTTPGFRMCFDSQGMLCQDGIKTAGHEFLREQAGLSGGVYVSQGYDYVSHSLDSRAIQGVLKTWDSIDGWRCFSNTDEQCGAARVSPGQNAQYLPFGFEQSLTLPILTVTAFSNTTRTLGSALIHDWQRVGVQALDPSTVQSTSFIGNIYHRAWAYVLSSYNFGGTLGTQNYVLVLEDESVGDLVSPYGFVGGSRLERYVFARGFGLTYAEGEKNAACSAANNATNCNGTYTTPDPGPATLSYRLSGDLPIQDPLDPSNIGKGTFNIVDWW
jgi:hypothetical protein